MEWIVAAGGAGVAVLAIAFAWAVSSDARLLSQELKAAHKALSSANQEVHANRLAIQTMEKNYTRNERGLRAENERLKRDLKDIESLLEHHGGPDLVLARLRQAVRPRRSADDLRADAELLSER